MWTGDWGGAVGGAVRAVGLEKGVVCEGWGQGVRKGVTASVLTCRLDNVREAGASGF